MRMKIEIDVTDMIKLCGILGAYRGLCETSKAECERSGNTDIAQSWQKSIDESKALLEKLINA